MADVNEQVEALQAAGQYCEKLIKGIENVVTELSGNRLPDTDEYLKTVIQGINWVFEVYNGTREFINQQGIVIDKDYVNQAVIELNDAEKNNDDEKRVEALKGGILTFIKEIKATADKLTEQ